MSRTKQFNIIKEVAIKALNDEKDKIIKSEARAILSNCSSDVLNIYEQEIYDLNKKIKTLTRR